MPASPPERSSVEAMAFQVVLAELGALQRDMQAMQQAVQQMLPLLTKIVGLLEAQGQQPEVPVATYDQLYTELQPPPESESTPVAVDEPRPHVLFGSRRLWQWFVQKDVHADHLSL
jgi:hypothetical protein